MQVTVLDAVPVVPKKRYTCLLCNKDYAGYKSLWTHNNKIHGVDEQEHDACTCKVCNKVFKHKSSMYRHQKKCAEAKKAQDDLERERKNTVEIELLKQNMTKMQQTVKRMRKEKIEARAKTVTVKKINQMLAQLSEKVAARNQIMNQSMNHDSFNNTHSNNQYHIQILQLGSEQVLRSLSMEDKQAIIDKRMCSLEKIVELVHCGVQDMYKNILITNLKDRYCYRFDKDQGQFVTATKADVLEELIENRIGDLEAIYDEFATANKIDQKTRRLIQTFLDKLAEDNVQYTDDTAVYPSYRDYKKHNIKILLYKNKDRISRDIALLIGDRISTLEDDPFAFAIEASMAKTTTNTIIG